MIYSKTREEHIDHIKKAIELLKQNFISINFAKFKFFKESIAFLGNIISSKVISPDPAKVLDLEKHINIKSKKEMQSLIGFVN